MRDVTAVILAGGLGTRLRPAVADRPKVLAEVHGRPFLAYVLDQVAAAGITGVVVCTGYRGQEIRRAFGEAYGALRLHYSHESTPLGTGGALRLAAPLLRSATALVMNGDSFCDVDLAALRAWHRAHRSAATLTLVQLADASRYGCVQVDGHGAVTRFEEKREAVGSGWVNAGIYLCEPVWLGALPAAGGSLERDIFPAWVGRGLYGCQSTARFLDIGTPAAYHTAQQFFAMESRT